MKFACDGAGAAIRLHVDVMETRSARGTFQDG
jgi:hypothetical protein